MSERYINGLRVYDSYVINYDENPIFVEQGGTLYMQQVTWSPKDNEFVAYYVDLSTPIEKHFNHKIGDKSNSEENENKNCNDCKFSEVASNEYPCHVCWDHNFYEESNIVNIKLHDTNGNWHSVDISIKSLTFKDIKVGDELELIDENPKYQSQIIITYNNLNRASGFIKSNGAAVRLYQDDLSNWRKTGKTYPEIVKIIGGDKNE